MLPENPKENIIKPKNLSVSMGRPIHFRKIKISIAIAPGGMDTVRKTGI